MTRRRFHGAVASLLACPLAAAHAGPDDPGAADRDLLRSYARDTWRSFEALDRPGGLPADHLRRERGEWVAAGFTSPTNAASMLWSTLAAESLGLVSKGEAGRRLRRTLSALAGLERSRGFFLNWYDPDTGLPLRTWPGGAEAVRPFVSAVDNGWLAAALWMVGNARPALRDEVEGLLSPLHFDAFYDDREGLLRGGFWADDGAPAGFHYGMLNTEPRIASYLGIARGDLPPSHYYRMSRGGADAAGAPTRVYGGVEVAEGTRAYRGLRLVPSWDGTMFEALMVPLFVPEDAWAPGSWGVNHPLYARAQVEFGLQDAKLGTWGISASTDPAGGYRAYGVAALGAGASPGMPGGIVTPHATFLALRYAPTAAMANLRALASDFPIYGPFGFLDAADVATHAVSERVLALDQGMILAAIANALEGDVMRHILCDGPFEAAIRPLIAPERFDAGEGPVAGRTAEARAVPLRL